MANYDLEVSNNGAYNPLVLQAFAETQQGLTDQYNTSMTAYGELESKANLLEKLANDVKGKDSIAYKNYMNYANALRQHTDTLATYGLNPNLTRNLIQARSDYSKIIQPIEEAYQARQNEAKRQADYLKAHPGTMFEKDASKMGIDEWLKNPTYQAQSVDLDNVSKIAGERFEALKNKLQQFVSEAQAGGLNPATATAEDVKKWSKIKGVPYLYEAIEKYGVNPDDVRALLSGDPRMMNSMLQHVIDETMAQSGVNTWNTDYDHYTQAQNEQNRRNIFERARGAIAGEATKSIGTDKFDKYKDDISWRNSLEWAQLAENKRHNKAIEELSGSKSSGGGGSGSLLDKWEHYWQQAGSTANTEENVSEPKSQYNIRAFIKANPELAKVINRKDWDNILEEVAKENQLNSPSAVTVDRYMNQIVDKIRKIQEKNKEYYRKSKNAVESQANYGPTHNSYLAPKSYSPEGYLVNSGIGATKNLAQEHEDFMNKNVRTLYANKKSAGVGEADEDEVLSNMTKGYNKTFVVSNLGSEDIKFDIAPLANMIGGDKSKKANLNLFLNEDGVPYEGDTWFSSKDQEGFIDEVLGIANGTIKNGQWSKSYDFDTKGQAHIRINANGKETFVSPEIIGIPGGTKYAQKMLDILTDSERILRSKTTTQAAKAAAETRKTAAQAGLGYILGADKDWHTKPNAIGYDGEKKFIEEELALGLNELFPNIINN